MDVPACVAAADAAGGGHRPPEAWPAGGDPSHQKLRERSASATLRARAASRGAGGGRRPAPEAAEPKGAAQETEGGAEAEAAPLLELALVAEELTDALERSREAEEARRRELAEARRQLREERAGRAACELALRRAHEALGEALRAGEARAAEARELKGALEERERAMEELRRHFQRLEVECGLERALACKGRSLRFRHLDV